ncbi:MAG: SOS response-associated peptidase [Acidimicrobiales bacterium]|nr:SOS response-associated peptidase [Acidimicrobiales bacterium]MBO0893019.1 SOS response-associated peptidase [Acidimicrobiales bacterium]
MCGRFVSTTPPAVLAERFRATVIDPDAEEVGASWNVAPTDVVNAVVSDREERRIRPLRWGLVPSFARDPGGGARMINARAETIGRAPAFRAALARRRCLVPAEGFYEWRRLPRRASAPAGSTSGVEPLRLFSLDPDRPARAVGSGVRRRERRDRAGAGRGAGREAARPFYFRRKDGDLLALAGLWELWRDAGGQWLATCSVVTTDATEPVSEIHDRMPVVLSPEHWEDWLDPDALDAAEAEELVSRPQAAGLLERWAVSPEVNSVRNNSSRLIEPHPEG